MLDVKLFQMHTFLPLPYEEALLPRLKRDEFIYVTGRIHAQRRDYFCVDRVEELRRQETRP